MKIGSLLTVSWLGFLLGFYWASGPMLATLRPNELGDMLAGSFSPLAFAWIVITVMLQGKELQEQREEVKRSGEALAKQAEELQKSVGEMKAAYKQREDERRLQLIREVARRIVHLMYVIADECRPYSFVHLEDGRPDSRGDTIFGKSDLYLEWSNRDEFELAGREFLARLVDLRDVMNRSEYRVNVTYAGVDVLRGHLRAMQERIGDIGRLEESAPDDARIVFRFELFRELERAIEEVVGRIEELLVAR